MKSGDAYDTDSMLIETFLYLYIYQWYLNYLAYQVLDMQAYEARQKEYASRGQRHFYFMTLNGSEVWIISFTSLIFVLIIFYKRGRLSNNI